MLYFIIFFVLAFLILFWNDVMESKYILLLTFLIRLFFIVIIYYYIDYSKIALSDDLVYYYNAGVLMKYTFHELFFTQASYIILIVSGGFHVLYYVINYIIYSLFGHDIKNMLLYNFSILICAMFIMKKLLDSIDVDSKFKQIFLLTFLLYPSFIAWGILNLKDFTLLTIFAMLVYSSQKILYNRTSRANIVLNILAILSMLLLLLVIRFYLVGLYFIALASYFITNKNKFMYRMFITSSLVITLVTISSFYHFALSPFFMTVEDSYFFYKIPAFFNLFIFFPVTYYGLIKQLKKNNLYFIQVLLIVIFVFFSMLGGGIISGPRQRIFIEPFYILFFVYGLYAIKSKIRIGANKK